MLCKRGKIYLVYWDTKTIESALMEIHAHVSIYLKISKFCCEFNNILNLYISCRVHYKMTKDFYLEPRFQTFCKMEGKIVLLQNARLRLIWPPNWVVKIMEFGFYHFTSIHTLVVHFETKNPLLCIKVKNCFVNAKKCIKGKMLKNAWNQGIVKMHAQLFTHLQFPYV